VTAQCVHAIFPKFLRRSIARNESAPRIGYFFKPEDEALPGIWKLRCNTCTWRKETAGGDSSGGHRFAFEGCPYARSNRSFYNLRGDARTSLSRGGDPEKRAGLRLFNCPIPDPRLRFAFFYADVPKREWKPAQTFFGAVRADRPEPARVEWERSASHCESWKRECRRGVGNGIFNLSGHTSPAERAFSSRSYFSCGWLGVKQKNSGGVCGAQFHAGFSAEAKAAGMEGGSLPMFSGNSQRSAERLQARVPRARG